MKASELQAIRYLIKKELSELHLDRDSLRRSESVFYQDSESSTNRGKICFLFLNKTRNEITRISDRIGNLNTLLKSVNEELKINQSIEDSIKYLIYLRLS